MRARFGRSRRGRFPALGLTALRVPHGRAAIDTCIEACMLRPPFGAAFCVALVRPAVLLAHLRCRPVLACSPGVPLCHFVFCRRASHACCSGVCCCRDTSACSSQCTLDQGAATPPPLLSPSRAERALSWEPLRVLFCCRRAGACVGPACMCTVLHRPFVVMCTTTKLAVRMPAETRAWPAILSHAGMQARECASVVGAARACQHGGA